MNIPYSSILIGILLLTFALAGTYAVVNDLADNTGYGVTLSNDYVNTFDNTEKIQNKTIELQETINKTSVDKTAFLALVPDAISILKDTITLPFNVVGGIFQSLTAALNLPSWANTFFLVSALIVLIFTFVSYVLRWRS